MTQAPAKATQNHQNDQNGQRVPAAPDPIAAQEAPQVLAPAAPSPATTEPQPQHTMTPTRISMVWTMVGVGAALLLAILVFILQNGQRVRVRFLLADGTIPLGVGLMFAALLGALLVLAAGAARVLQLRRVARRHRRADQLP
jgi:lipopolysaccharide assembly protein A